MKVYSMDLVELSDVAFIEGALKSSKYPDITSCSQLEQILSILKISWKELKNDQLTAEEISNFLWKCAKIDIRPKRVTNILNAAHKKAKITKQNGKVYYSLTQTGDLYLGGKQELHKYDSDLFDKELIEQLGKRFNMELSQAQTSYMYECGDSLAFLLRKILEKAIYLSFATNGKLDRIKDPNNSHYFGLEKLIDICTTEKGGDGTPFLIPKTAKELRGIKFLGDTSAHDFLYNVKVSDIKTELPIFKVSLGQLAKKL